MQARPRKGWSRLRWALLLASLTASLTLLGASSAHACSSHGTAAGNDISDWMVGDPDGDGLVEFFVGIENELVPPSTSTVCVCGIGLGTASNRLPAGAAVTAAHVAVVDVASRTVTDLSAFVFSANPNTTAGLAAGSGPGGPPDTRPLFEGATWFGFASTVDPFSVPSLGPGEIIALGFDLDLPVEALPLEIEVQFAAGEGDASGNPLFAGDHPPHYFSGANPVVSLPEPGSLLGELALASVALLRGRRRGAATRRTRGHRVAPADVFAETLGLVWNSERTLIHPEDARWRRWRSVRWWVFPPRDEIDRWFAGVPQADERKQQEQEENEA